MNVETKVVESQHYGYVQNHKPYGEHVKGESAFLEAFKERRSHLQPHAIYKEHETEVLHEVEYFHGAGVCAFGHTGFVYVPHEYSREQHKCHAERYSSHLDFSEHHSRCYHNGENYHYVRHGTYVGKQVIKPFHFSDYLFFFIFRRAKLRKIGQPQSVANNLFINIPL